MVNLLCPEPARILDEFEGTLNITSNEIQEHHNSTILAHSSFQKDLKLPLSVINKVENPFLDDSYDLYTLDTKYLVPEDFVSSTLLNLEESEEKQLYEFMKSRLWNRATAATSDNLIKI